MEQQRSMDEFMMDDWMLTKVKRPIYEALEPHVNAPEPRQQRRTAAACPNDFTMANRHTRDPPDYELRQTGSELRICFLTEETLLLFSANELKRHQSAKSC